MQNVHDSFNVNAAQGKSLDDLCALIGIYRENASKTNGYVEFTGSNGVPIPSGTQMSNPDTKDTFVTTSNTELTTDAAYSVTYQIVSVENSTQYSITVDNVTESFTTDVDATVTELRDGIVSALTGNVFLDYMTISSVSSDQFTIVHDTTGNVVYSSPSSSNISPIRVTSLAFIEASENGAIAAPSGSISVIDTPIVDLDTVTNLTSLTTGRLVETDDELRIRRSLFASQPGKATPEAIARSVETVQGVTDAFVVENRTLTTDGDGRPGKSYEVIVFGGENQAVASAIWEAGPAGVQTYGLISENILDLNDDIQQVNFSRPVSKYVTFEVDYTTYDEETFPADGINGIKAAIIEYATNNAIQLGKDIIPQRYFGGIYADVPGIETLVIRVDIADTPGGVPASITTTPIAIGPREIPDFSVDRITVTQV